MANQRSGWCRGNLIAAHLSTGHTQEECNRKVSVQLEVNSPLNLSPEAFNHQYTCAGEELSAVCRVSRVAFPVRGRGTPNSQSVQATVSITNILAAVQIPKQLTLGEILPSRGGGLV